MQVLPIFADEGCWARDDGGHCDLPMLNNLGLCPEHLPEFFEARDDDDARPDFALAWKRLRAGFPPDVLLGTRSLGSYLRG